MALWTPAEIQTALWIDPSAYASLADLADKSNDARSLTTAGTLALSGTINSRKTISFGGGQINVGGAALNSQTVTVFYVLRGTTDSTTQTLWGGAGETSQDAIVPIAQSGSTGFPWRGINTRTSPPRPQIYTIGSGITWGNRGQAYTTLSDPNPQVLTLGEIILEMPVQRIGAAPFNYRYRGFMGEIVFAKGDLSTDNRQRMEGYLAHRWGTQASLPTDHPYRNAPPEVAGGADPSIYVGAAGLATKLVGPTAFATKYLGSR